MYGKDGDVTYRLQLELSGHRSSELGHIVEVHGIVIGNADHARNILVVLDVGHGAEHLVNLMGLDELLHVI